MRLWTVGLGSLAVLAVAGHFRANSGSFQSRQTVAIDGQKRHEVAPSSDLIGCPQPNHHDGDALRCGYHGRSMRLYAIDAPEMPGATARPEEPPTLSV